MSSSDEDAASSPLSASPSTAATAIEQAPLSEVPSEPRPDSSPSKSNAASAEESAESVEERAKSPSASHKSDAVTEPSVAATGRSEGISDSDASSGTSEAAAATADGDADEGDCDSCPEIAATDNGPCNESNTEADGSDAGESSGESSEADLVSEAGTAATAKVDSSKMVETFDAGASQTLAEHAAAHDFPLHVGQCGVCRFWKNKEKWSACCSATNPVTQKKETWLGHAGGGLGVCLFCAAFKGKKCLSDLGRGTGSFSRLQNIRRHATCKEHREAEAAWKERVRRESTSQGAEAFSEAATAAPILPVLRQSVVGSGSRGIVAARALLETSSSFRSFDVWRDGLLGHQDRLAVGSPWQCRRLVFSMALHEKLLTQKILKEGVVFRLSADGLERTYQVEIGTVLWSLPKALEFLPRFATNAGWLEQLGLKGPWLVERLIGMREFPGGMGTDGKATMLEDCVRRACQALGGEVDVDLHKHVREETRAWVSDGADLGVPLAATAMFPHMRFHGWDESHSAQALLKNSLRDDAEISITDSVLVTRKKPPSLAKFCPLPLCSATL